MIAMTVSKYFNHLEHDGEIELYDSIVQESIQISGFDILYIKRDCDIDPILHEARNSAYKQENSWTIEANIPENLMGWQGESLMMSQFGIQVELSGSILISKTRWDEIMAERQAAGLSYQERPFEGDLIYFGYGHKKFTNTLFQVNKVDFSDANWQHGRTFVYRMRCTLYKPTSDDALTVSEFDIDKQIEGIMDIEDLIKQNTPLEDSGDEIKTFDETNPFGGF